jgi:hypothetical protein
MIQIYLIMYHLILYELIQNIEELVHDFILLICYNIMQLISLSNKE